MVVLSFLSVCSWGAHSLSASLTIQVNRIKGFRPHQRVNYNYNIMCTHPLIHTCTPTHTHPLIHTPHTYIHPPTHTYSCDNQLDWARLRCSRTQCCHEREHSDKHSTSRPHCHHGHTPHILTSTGQRFHDPYWTTTALLRFRLIIIIIILVDVLGLCLLTNTST